MARATKTKQDKLIEQAWYRQAQGVQVNIMDISKIFAHCRKAMAEGSKLEDVIDVCIETYRQN